MSGRSDKMLLIQILVKCNSQFPSPNLRAGVLYKEHANRMWRCVRDTVNKVNKVNRRRFSMLKKSVLIATAALAAAGFSTVASANGDAVLGAALGAGVGAIIGNGISGRDGAIVGGAIGAAAGAAATTSHRSYVSSGVAVGAPVYYGPPAPVYYAPAPVYYAPAPVYYAPAPVVYASPPVVVYRPRPAYVVRPAPVYYGPAYYRVDVRHRGHDHYDRWH
jgi:hypothetical protein